LPFHFSPFIGALDSSSIGVQNMALPKKIGTCYGIPKLKPKSHTWEAEGEAAFNGKVPL